MIDKNFCNRYDHSGIKDQSYSWTTNLTILVLGIFAGYIINVFYVYFLDPLPFSDEYLLSVGEYWRRVIIFNIGIIHQYLIAAIVVLPVFCIGIGVVLARNSYRVSRLFTLGIALTFVVEQQSLFGSRNAGWWIIDYIFEIIIFLVTSYTLIKIGNNVKKYLGDRPNLSR